MGILSQRLGRAEQAKSYHQQAEALGERINSVFWDETDGFYYDRNERSGQLVRIKSIAGLLPLWLGIVPQPRAERLLREHILNPDEFWLPYPLATWAKNEPGYYQECVGGECTWMGATWVVTNYIVFHGLLRHGFTDCARQLAQKTCDMAMGNPETREYYNGKTGAGQGLNPFWGWSTLSYVMLAECELRYDPTELARTDYLILFADMIDL